MLAHGFTQTARLWGPFGEALARRHQLIACDLPGHAGSSEVRADLSQGAELLVEAARQAGVTGPFDLLGYSLGARLALHAALGHPEAVRRLVIIGGTAGLEDEEVRTRRRARDDGLADELERSGDVAAFLTRWLAAPMFATLGRPELAERLRNTAPGLASSLRLAGTGTQAPLWDRLGGLERPVLVLVGATDVRFALIGQRMVAALPDAAFSLVPGAGHPAHLEQPESSALLVERFLTTGSPG